MVGNGECLCYTCYCWRGTICDVIVSWEEIVNIFEKIVVIGGLIMADVNVHDIKYKGKERVRGTRIRVVVVVLLGRAMETSGKFVVVAGDGGWWLLIR